MQEKTWPVVAVSIPAESAVLRAYPTTHLADAYSIRLPDNTAADPLLLARFLFSQQPAWVPRLMRVRDFLVSAFGLKTSRQLLNPAAASRTDRVHIFRIYATGDNEVILGEDDTHLDFRLSVRYQAGSLDAGRAPHLVVSTVVHCHNLLGRLYIALIAPFHRLVIKSGLRRAARIGWPAAALTNAAHASA
ncbi:MAG: hypothetical protein JWR60_4274 [Polaromonas sp.]|nr:hypothetical protein [Polaromonas sp.]